MPKDESVSSGDPMTVQLTPDVHWINQCYQDEENDVHEHVSVYLIEHGDQYVLIDSGSFHHEDQIAAAIEAATDGHGLDALILSHSDYPHSGNVGPFAAEQDDVELVASSGSPEAQGLPPTATKCEIGGSLDVLGRTFSFIDPPLADRSHTTWIYDHGSHVLFTADGFGSRHQPGECTETSATLDDGIALDDIYTYHKETLVWLRYVDPQDLEEALRSILNEYQIDYIAPVHGHPISGEDIDRYMDRLMRAVHQIADEYTVPAETAKD